MTTSPREQDIPHTTLRVHGHEVTVATTRLVEPRGVRTQALTMGQLTIGVGQSIATWGQEERREGRVSTWLLLALSPLPHGVALLCRGPAAPAQGLRPFEIVNPPEYKPPCWSWARRCCSPSPWKQ